MVNVSLLAGLVLIGTIAGRTPVAVFQEPGKEATKAVQVGDQLEGCVIDTIEPKRVTLRCGKDRRVLTIGQSPKEAELESAITVRDNSITISSELKSTLEGADLARTLMQTCSEAVTNPDGSLKGYRLFEIDAGSIYQVVGFQDGDVVTDIDGQPLNSPMNAMSALMDVKKKDRFTVSFVRGGVPKTLQVSVQ